MTGSGDIQVVVFDLDDTLYPEHDYMLSGYVAVSHFLQGSLGRTENFAAWLWGHFLRDGTDRAFNHLSDHFGLDLDEDHIQQLVRVYRRHEPQIGLGPGIVDLLAAIQTGGKRMGLLSDGFLPAQPLKLAALGISDRFSAIVFTEEIGRDAWKPSPVGFEKIVADLGVPHDACVYVADNPAKDFVAPNALGWRTIHYRFEGQIHAATPAPAGGQPQRTADSPEKLLAMLV